MATTSTRDEAIIFLQKIKANMFHPNVTWFLYILKRFCFFTFSLDLERLGSKLILPEYLRPAQHKEIEDIIKIL